MNITNFIKKLITLDVIWGTRTKKLTGVKDKNNLITDNFVISDVDNSITFSTAIPDFLQVDTYFRITGGNNDGQLFRVMEIQGNKIITYENLTNDSGSLTLDARLWVVHNDENISKASSNGSTIFNLSNTSTTGLDDGSGIAKVFAEHYHADSGTGGNTALGAKTTFVIPANTESVIDQVALADFFNLKYYSVFSNSDNDNTKSMEVTVKKSALTVCHSISNRIGTGINLEINPTASGSNFEMRVRNNENYDVTMCYAKMTL